MGNAAKNWVFTLPILLGGNGGNVPDVPDVPTILKDALQLRKLLLTFCDSFVFQAEKGGESGYLHYQGRFSLPVKKRLTALKKLIGDKAHLEIERDEIGSLNYCSKSETRIAGPWTEKAILRNTLTYDELYPWQREVVDGVQGYSDERTVKWFWEPEGRVGKSALARYMIDNIGECLYVDGGTKADIAQYVISSKITAWENPIIIFNIPRQKTMISYAAIESLKDGMMFSSKYESNMVRFNSPHIIVFANFEPDEMELSKLSADRWQITKIEKKN